MRERRQSCAARPREEERHAVSKIRRAVSMEITVEDSKSGKITAMRERKKTVRHRKGTGETKSF